MQHTRLTVLLAVTFTTLMTATAGGGDAAHTLTRLHLIGTMHRKIALEADLVFKRNGEIEGSYCYSHVGLPLQLKGQIDKEQNITLTERDENGKVTGSFIATFDPNRQTLSGTWQRPDGSGARKIYLSPIAEYIFSERRLGDKVIANSTYPVFIARNKQPSNVIIAQRMRDAQAKFFNEWQKVWLEDPDLPTHVRFGRVDRCKIVWYSDDLLSLQRTVREYTGGAHGNSWFMPINLWRRGDAWKELTLTDIFDLENDGAAKALSNACVAQLRKQEASDILNDPDATLHLGQLQCFTLSPNGITFFFAPYEVGSYAEGAFDVMLEWKPLAEHVRNDSPVWRWASPHRSR